MIAAIGENHEERWSLEYQWIEMEFSVTGFYLVDRRGKVYEFPDVYVLGQNERNLLANTDWRDGLIPVIRDKSDRAWENPKLQAHLPPSLLPDLDYTNGNIRLGLMSKAGREPATVEIAFKRSKDQKTI